MEEAKRLIELLDELKPLMEKRIIDKYETYGSIYQYDNDKFRVNLLENYAQFIKAVVYREEPRAVLKAADMINLILMIIESSGIIV